MFWLWVWALSLLWINSADKGSFLAAVEGFSPQGLARPWDHSNNERNTHDTKRKGHRSSTIRFYVNEEHDSTSPEEEIEGESASNDMKNSTRREEDLDSNEDGNLCASSAKDSNATADPAVTAFGSKTSVLPSSTTVHHLAQDHRSPRHAQQMIEPTVKSCLPDLIAMTRPSNLPAVVLFHMLGTYLAVRNTAVASSYWSILFSPSMIITLLALLLTSSTSMLVNDYYDFKLGHDSTKPFQPLNTPNRLPLKVLKRFLSYLYAAALVTVTMVPGVPARMAVIMGLMLTFWYTQHLKPRTWLKNAVCATLIALSPLTSAVGAMSVTGVTGEWVSLLQVVGMLFVGILGREVTMDISDVQDDSHHGVRTVPVVYGCKFASTIGLVCALGVSGLALVGPFMEAAAGNLCLRRLLLATAGATAQLRRAWQVFQSEGQDKDLIGKAVNEGLITVVLILASFV